MPQLGRFTTPVRRYAATAPSPAVAPSSPSSAARTAGGSVDGNATAFVHPGVLVGSAQLDFVRGKVLAGAEPWKSAYTQMMASPLASLTRPATPRAVVECGSYSNPDHGCTDERKDALAAYTTALAWYITRDARYSAKAIQIMDAWSAVITSHTGSNGPLQTSWAGSTWPRAAEIIRYRNVG